MDVRLSAEQVALRDSVAQVVDRLGPKAVGQLDDPERATKLDAAVTASGWRELRTATDEGAPWASGVEVAIVADGLARGSADVAFLGPTMAVELRRLAGLDAADGQTIAVDGVAFDVAGADVALALDGTRVVRFAVGAELPRVDLTRPSAAVTGMPEHIGTLAAADAVRWRALGLALTCADLVGAMRGAVDLSSEYAKQRRQYGTSIGSFQAVQHLLADAFTLVEGSHSVALHAAWAVDALAPDDAVGAAALAKAYCARAARDVCETAIQVHGGIGNTWECMAHVFLRRTLLATELFGGIGPSLTTVLEHHGLR